MGQKLGQNKFLENALKYGFSLWGLPKTGQTTSYRTGDDGDLEKGYPKDPPRYKDNGDGTISDKATGLMWVKEPGALGGAWGTPGNPSQMTWDNAIDNCLALNYAGHNDWRLPNITELHSILNLGKLYPIIDTDFFPDTKSAYYWTSTCYFESPTAKGFVYFLYFYEGTAGKENPFYVRPVRLGIP